MRFWRMITVAAAGLFLLSGLAACSSDDGDDIAGIGQRATAAMSGPDGSPMGTVTLEQGPHGVLVSADISGLSPGGHGFHIHTVGTCTPDFSAAGGHFAPGERGHGFMYADGLHAGDLPNIYAAGDGTARADYFTDLITVAADAETSVFDADGSTFIVHAKPGHLPIRSRCRRPCRLRCHRAQLTRPTTRSPGRGSGRRERHRSHERSAGRHRRRGFRRAQRCLHADEAGHHSPAARGFRPGGRARQGRADRRLLGGHGRVRLHRHLRHRLPHLRRAGAAACALRR